MTTPTKPDLWERVKAELRATRLGSSPGRWSPRKAVLAQLEYERLGGAWDKTPAPPPPGA